MAARGEAALDTEALALAEIDQIAAVADAEWQSRLGDWEAHLDTQKPLVARDALEDALREAGLAETTARKALDDNEMVMRGELLSYFENFMAADAFLEFRDLETYAITGEELQLYLYIGQMKFGGRSYPLFYVPIEVQRLPEGGYVCTLINHLYANKRAIDYVLQELGERAKRQWLNPINEVVPENWTGC